MHNKKPQCLRHLNVTQVSYISVSETSSYHFIYTSDKVRELQGVSNTICKINKMNYNNQIICLIFFDSV